MVITSRPLPPLPEIDGIWRHVGSGHRYRVVGAAREEDDLSIVVVYERVDGTDRALIPVERWIRPWQPFLDRFIAETVIERLARIDQGSIGEIDKPA